MRYFFFPLLTISLMLGPVLAGLAGTLLPAFGWLPAIGGNQLSLMPFKELIGQPALGTSIWLSFKTGLVSTLLAVLLVALLLANWHGTKAFNLLRKSISPLLSVPHAAAAFGIAFLLAPSGLIMRLISPELTGLTVPPQYLFPADPGGWSLILGLTIKEVPFILLMALGAWPQLQADQKLKLAAGLGYGRNMAFLHTVWPQLYSQIRLAIFAVLAFATSVVDVSLILGPSTPPTLPVRLLQWMNDPDLSKRFLACAGAMAQLTITLSTIAIWILLEKCGAWLRTILVRSGKRMPQEASLRFMALSINFSAILTITLGLIVLAIWSFAGFWKFPDILPQSFTLKSWTKQSSSLFDSVSITLIIAAASVAIGLALVLAWLESSHRQNSQSSSARAIGESKLLQLVIYLPLLVPQISFVFGLQLFALSLGIDTQLWAVIWVHLIFVLPYLFLIISAPWRELDPRYAQLTSGLGRSPNAYFWLIRLPMLTRVVLTAMAVGLAVSIAQYLPTLLIGAGRITTITTEAVALTSGGNRRVIGVFAFVQLCLPFIGFALAAALSALIFKNRREMAA